MVLLQQLKCPDGIVILLKLSLILDSIQVPVALEVLGKQAQVVASLLGFIYRQKIALYTKDGFQAIPLCCIVRLDQSVGVTVVGSC